MIMLVVLGMHRSGTSALTGVLNKLGFTPGNQVLKPNAFNERGYFEDARISNRLDELLISLDRNWYDERVMPSDWLATDAVAHAARDLVTLLAEEFDFNQPCVIKDPRICRLLPLMQMAWAAMSLTPSYVFSLRSPLAVMRSLSRRDSIAPEHAALLYVAHLLDAELATRGAQRVFVEYDTLLQDWRGVVNQISSCFGLDLLSNEHNVALRGVDIDAFLSDELNHYEVDKFEKTSCAVGLALEVYSLLKRPMNDAVAALLDDVRRRWLGYLDSLEPWLSDATTLRRLRVELPSALLNPTEVMAKEASLNAKSDIYWATETESFGDGGKLQLAWEYGKRADQRFVVPPVSGQLKALRFDISDRPAFCDIERFWIEDASGSALWDWKSGTNLFANLSSDMHVIGENEAGHLIVVASGFDPYAQLLIPSLILRRIEAGWVVRVIWTALLPTTAMGLILEQLSNTYLKLVGTKAALTSSVRDCDELARKTSMQAEHLLAMDNHVKLLRQEISRAEAQLDLLKDLLLGNRPSESL